MSFWRLLSDNIWDVVGAYFSLFVFSHMVKRLYVYVREFMSDVYYFSFSYIVVNAVGSSKFMLDFHHENVSLSDRVV